MLMHLFVRIPREKKDYFDFFDNRAFADGSPYYPCYCNAFNMSAGEFDLDHLPDDSSYSHSLLSGQVLSVVCFEISPNHRGRGIATILLKQICSDAAQNGYQYVEAYPEVGGQTSLAFTGPVRLYEKNGFSEFKNDGKTIIMRKHLN